MDESGYALLGLVMTVIGLLTQVARWGRKRVPNEGVGWKPDRHVEGPEARRSERLRQEARSMFLRDAP